SVWLGYAHPSHCLRPVAFLAQFGFQLGDQSLDSLLLNLLDGLPIHAGGPSVGFDLTPRLGQDVLAVHLVVQRMEPPRRTRLRGPVQGSLKFSRFVWGGSSPSGTHRRLPPANPQTK